MVKTLYNVAVVDENPVYKTRVFDPDDVQHRSEDDIKARLEELKAKRESFDPKTQFTGLRRLGASYTIAEPLAFFDGPTEEQRKLNYALIYGGCGLVTALGVMMTYKLKGGAYLTGLARGAAVAPFGAYGFGKFNEYIIKSSKRKNNILLHYALLNEHEFPVIGKLFSNIGTHWKLYCSVGHSLFSYSLSTERKKYGEVIQNWTPHRSLNVMQDKQIKWW